MLSEILDKDLIKRRVKTNTSKKIIIKINTPLTVMILFVRSDILTNKSFLSSTSLLIVLLMDFKIDCTFFSSVFWLKSPEAFLMFLSAL
ncbi:MAG: hypothetical protein KAR07_01795 [Spirochaetes bacterium]|nr:hypothetical protein [Spirochaetota bacterium]